MPQQQQSTIPDMDSQGGAVNLNQIQEMAMAMVYNFCSIVTMPVEMALRPHYGTRYFSPVITFLSTVMMALLPLFVGIASTATQLIPFMSVPPPQGMFWIGALSSLFFWGLFIHGIRTWRRMINMALEENSHYEGPPLPIFSMLPKGKSFWFVRIVWEPLFLIFAGMFLERTFILQSSAATFLEISGLLLAMKNYISWYHAWAYLRNLLDMRFTGPLIAKLVENKATEDDLATIHLPSFPKNLPPEIRQAAAMHIARVYSQESGPETPAVSPKREETAVSPARVNGSSGKADLRILIVLAILALIYFAANLRNASMLIRQHNAQLQRIRTPQSRASAPNASPDTATAPAPPPSWATPEDIEKHKEEQARAAKDATSSALPVDPSIKVKGSVAGAWKGSGGLGNRGSCYMVLGLMDSGGFVAGKGRLQCTLNPISHQQVYDYTIINVKGTSVNGSGLLDHIELVDRSRFTPACIANLIVLTRTAPDTMYAQFHDESCGGQGSGQIMLNRDGSFMDKTIEAAFPQPPPPQTADSAEKQGENDKPTLLGSWEGLNTLPDRGLCSIVLSLPQDAPSQLRLECRQNQYQDKPDIFVTTLIGKWQNMDAALRDDRIIEKSKDAKPCLAESIALHPIAGTDKIVVIWSNPPCHGGQAILSRRAGT